MWCHLLPVYPVPLTQSRQQCPVLVMPCVTTIQCIPLAAEAKCELVLLGPGWAFPGVSLQPRPGCEWLSLCVTALCWMSLRELGHHYCTQQLFLFPFPVLSGFHILFILESGLTQQEAIRQFIHILYFTIASTRKEMV